MEHITIYLGSRCNLNCAYCHRVADEKESEISESLLEYIRKNQENLFVKFIGGEPTLYMRQIRRVTDIAPKARYSIVTNGVGLSRYLDFFRRYRFLVCISYDGKEESLRGYDPFTELMNYPYLAVSTTIYHGNTDLRAIIRNFAKKERIIGRSLFFFPHILHVTDERNKQYALTAEDADSYVSQYKEMVGKYLEGRYRYGVSNIRYEGMFRALRERYEHPFSFGETYCVNKTVKKCDAAGRLFSCLYIRDEEFGRDTWQDAQREILRKKFPHCQSCAVYGMCGGACIKSRMHDIECRIYRNLYSWFKEEYPKWKMK